MGEKETRNALTMTEYSRFPTPEAEAEHIESKIIERVHEQVRAGSDNHSDTKRDIAAVLSDHVGGFEIPGEGGQNVGADFAHSATIQQLTTTAFNKGITEAVHMARSLKSPHLLKELHNALTDIFYDRLVASGLIQKE